MYKVFVGDKKVTESPVMGEAAAAAQGFAGGQADPGRSGKVILTDGMGNVLREYGTVHKETDGGQTEGHIPQKRLYLVRHLSTALPTRMMRADTVAVLASSSAEASLKARMAHKNVSGGAIRDIQAAPMETAMPGRKVTAIIP